ncbi:MAG: CheA signal transduction histidine kinase [Myxococcaceae bacterium]|nr:CheA signal transduction histidine kinase [Myxococcaceae bacterium]
MNDSDALPPEVYVLFRDETRENLEIVVRGLGMLEGQGSEATAQTLREIARALHTIKGGAAGVGYEGMARVAHAAEDALLQLPPGRRETTVARAAAWLEAAVGGATAGEAELLAEVRAELSRPEPGTPAGAPPAPAEPPPPAASPAPAPPRPSAPGSGPGSGPGDETVRVRVRAVEALLAPLAALTSERAESRFRTERLRRVADSARGLLRSATAAPLNSTELRELEHLVTQLDRETSAARSSAHALARSVTTAEDLVQRMRMVSVGSLEEPLRLAVRDAASRTGKTVRFEFVGAGVMVDRRVLDALRAPLLHLVRNAVDHGLESNPQRLEAGKPLPGRLTVRVVSLREVVELSVEDDGRGVDVRQVGARAVRLGLRTEEEARALTGSGIFAVLALPGFTTRDEVTELSGRGMGMDVVSRAVQALGGSAALQSTLGQGTTFTFSLPVSVLSTRVLFVRLGREVLAVPSSGIDGTERLHARAFYDVGGRRFANTGGAPLAVHELDPGKVAGDAVGRITVVRVRTRAGPLALLVDEVLGEEEVSVQPLGPPVRRIEGVIGSTVSESGEVVVVLDPRSLGSVGLVAARPEASVAPRATRARVLVVDDSITTRTLERHILERAGYLVDLARDGVEALAALRAGSYDLVVTDLEMPNLDGIGLVRQMRTTEALMAIPTILVTSVAADETRRRALAAGVNAYIVKRRFDQDELLQTIAEQLRGAASRG